MIILSEIINELVDELDPLFDLSRERVLSVVGRIALDLSEDYRDYDPLAVEGIKVTVIDGDELPHRHREVLKKLIKKVALRKLKELQEQQEAKAQKP